jgi:hypothetical protein
MSENNHGIPQEALDAAWPKDKEASPASPCSAQTAAEAEREAQRLAQRIFKVPERFEDATVNAFVTAIIRAAVKLIQEQRQSSAIPRRITMKDHIHVQLDGGAMANVDPDCPPETINALNEMVKHVRAAAERGELPESEGDSSAASCSPPATMESNLRDHRKHLQPSKLPNQSEIEFAAEAWLWSEQGEALDSAMRDSTGVSSWEVDRYLIPAFIAGAKWALACKTMSENAEVIRSEP